MILFYTPLLLHMLLNLVATIETACYVAVYDAGV